MSTIRDRLRRDVTHQVAEELRRAARHIPPIATVLMDAARDLDTIGRVRFTAEGFAPFLNKSRSAETHRPTCATCAFCLGDPPKESVFDGTPVRFCTRHQEWFTTDESCSDYARGNEKPHQTRFQTPTDLTAEDFTDVP